MIRRNDDPPTQYEAYEVPVGGHQFAWDEDGHVYVQSPLAMREDGYMLVGFFDGGEEEFQRYAMELVEGWRS